MLLIGSLFIVAGFFLLLSINSILRFHKLIDIIENILINNIDGNNEKEVCDKIYEEYKSTGSFRRLVRGVLRMNSNVINKKNIVIFVIGIVVVGIFLYLIYQNLNFLNDNAGAISLIFSGLVAIATIFYAILTWKLVTINEKMREPNVIVDFQPRKEWVNFMDIVIKNIGEFPAFDIKFNINPDFEYAKGKFLSQLGYMRGISYLAPKKTIRSFITSMAEDFEKKKVPFEIEVSYAKCSGGTRKTSNFRFDLSELEGLSQIGEDPMHKIAKNLEELKNCICPVTRGQKRVQTEVYTKEEVEKEKKKKNEEAKKMIEKEKKRQEKVKESKNKK